MKKKVFSKSMSWLLSVVMVLGVFVFYGTKSLTVSAEMTMDQFNARLSELQIKYPTGYVWKDKYYGKYELGNEYVNWVQCKGFAHLMGYEVFNSDPGTWPVDYNFNHLEPGDIIQFGDPNIPGGNHSVFCTSVSGDTYYFVDCNGNGNRDENGKYKAGLCMVLWGDKGYISKGSLYNGMHTFSYLIKSPIHTVNPPPDPITYDYMPVGKKYYLKNNGTGTYMSVDYGVDKQLQNISVYQFTKEEGQQYEIVGSDTDRSYFLRPVLCQSSGRVVNVNGEYTSAGANIMLYNYTGHSTQQWKFRSVSGGYEICSTNNTNYCISESGTNVQMASYTGASNQIWTLEPVEHHHEYTEYVYNWAAHPHYKCYRCSCGEVMENRNEPTYVETCPDCIASSRVDIGTGFYAYIINTYPWKMVSVNTDNDNNVELQSETALSNQLWYFERQDDLYYIITNVKTNYFLDDGNYGNTNGTNVGTWNRNGVSAQKWAIVECNGGYTLHPQCALEMALDVSGGSTADGANIQIYQTNNSAAQIFTLYRYGNKPSNPELTSSDTVYNKGESITVSWKPCSFAHNYWIDIWHNDNHEQSFRCDNLSYTLDNLDTGHYTIYVTACNHNGISDSVPVDFTVPNYTISPSVTGSYSGHTYEYYDTKLTWNQAYKFCEKKGGHLVTINSKEENDFLAGFTSGKVNNTWINAWTGGRTFDAETWFWITGEPFEYMNWNDGEPNNTDNAEDAVNIILTSDSSYNGKWNDMNRSNLSSIDGFICEYEDVDASKYSPVYRENYNGHEYWFFDEKVDWQTAKKVCEAKGGYLVIPNDAEENEMINSGVKHTSWEWTWLGISDIENEGVWKDVKGNIIQYTNWSYPQPDNYNGTEDYVHMYGDGSWNDANTFGVIGYYNVGFVCEFDDLCAASGHDYEETVIAPTETEQGYTLHTCKRCGDSYKDNYTDPVPVHLAGDINNDGKVNMKDATRLHQYINGWDVSVVEAALDVNGDGKVNMKDVTRLHQYINGWDVKIYVK